ncbi:hypothetical protein CPC08DRAFT_768097 [Agrocybe pediades]|nr:hypothetical protein CPC08DRAFT_768097 [Agrocybe pediades]
MVERKTRYRPPDTEDVQASTAPHTSLHQSHKLEQSIRNAEQLLVLMEDMISETDFDGTDSQILKGIVIGHCVVLTICAPPFALHAYTFSECEDTGNLRGLGEAELLEEAWSVQCTTDEDAVLFDLDVDLNCLAYLEGEMFVNSAGAGVAGNQQWGLDADDHEHGWNPYADLPAGWVYDNSQKEGKDFE